mmetsp:Transcript_18747/g.46435  ORF Transcript_18747/g.46435 Transcript_18747/m.46435 type:complete len:433 (+) Transcript_18747:152-1450(+)|eukprot:CAMPEP_0113647530 /NCGR_PEP_ID=MMETSP0017_2-20120614/25167_1 /TAXON_ID=2856 /ORGANISM="Cylindrotheca closterium" /LENGTH=432 /DNA_ID=CAMNT_0000559607 /DNA_START=104 /DNA_END=1402 /DNA_ORIENTATION=+ /assembly_acc=CAM_ASM_000147
MSSPSASSSSIRITPNRNRPGSNLRVQTDNDDDEDNHIDLLMRHSSPIDRRNHPNGSPSPITVRNSSSSPMGLSRPRSNPRNRTPMRYESPLPMSAVRIPEGDEDQEGHHSAGPATTTEGRRITILPMAGSARGTNIASFRNRQDGSNQGAATKSRKQGPSHRKVRRWNNDNFVNLAKEVGGSNKAAEALLRGHAHADQYRGILSQEQSKKSIMTKLSDSGTKSEELRYVRDKFYEGELHSSQPKAAKVNHKNHKKPSHLLTRDDKINRIDKRLRQVVTRAIENSLPATKVMETLEDFLIQAHTNNKDQTIVVPQDKQVWNDILSQPPTISRHGDDDDDKQILVLRFSFDSESSNGGFHRLLLHALVQFHGLAAHSATTPTGGRLLTATGYLADTNHKLVDSIMQRREERLQRENRNSKLEVQTNRLNALKV